MRFWGLCLLLGGCLSPRNQRNLAFDEAAVFCGRCSRRRFFTATRPQTIDTTGVHVLGYVGCNRAVPRKALRARRGCGCHAKESPKVAGPVRPEITNLALQIHTRAVITNIRHQSPDG